MKTYELTPVNGRKSFYGKCRVEESENFGGDKISVLRSYDTEVAEYNHNTNKMLVRGWYSNTTASHINAFLDHFGYETTNKEGMESYNEEK